MKTTKSSAFLVGGVSLALCSSMMVNTASAAAVQPAAFKYVRTAKKCPVYDNHPSKGGMAVWELSPDSRIAISGQKCVANFFELHPFGGWVHRSNLKPD